jgi:hypothetical protein
LILQKSAKYNNPNVTAVTVTVTLDEKQQYLIFNGVLMTIKQKLGEEKLVNLTGNKEN